MGKVMTISGADFSNQKIGEWNIDDSKYEAEINSIADISASPFIPVDYYKLQGRYLKCIRLVPKHPGTLSIIKQNDLLISNPIIIKQINIDSNELDTPQIYDVDVEVEDNDIIGISSVDDNGKFGFIAATTTDVGSNFYYYSNGTLKRLNRDNKLCVSFYVI